MQMVWSRTTHWSCYSAVFMSNSMSSKDGSFGGLSHTTRVWCIWNEMLHSMEGLQSGPDDSFTILCVIYKFIWKVLPRPGNLPNFDKLTFKPIIIFALEYFQCSRLTAIMHVIIYKRCMWHMFTYADGVMVWVFWLDISSNSSSPLFLVLVPLLCSFAPAHQSFVSCAPVLVPWSLSTPCVSDLFPVVLWLILKFLYDFCIFLCFTISCQLLPPAILFFKLLDFTWLKLDFHFQPAGQCVYFADLCSSIIMTISSNIQTDRHFVQGNHAFNLVAWKVESGSE